MKLVLNTDLQEGFIYKNKTRKEFIIYPNVNAYDDYSTSDPESMIYDKNGLFKCKESIYSYGSDYGKTLIGKLGITHEIKDNKLVEIERNPIYINDVFEITASEDLFFISYIESGELPVYHYIYDDGSLGGTFDDEGFSRFQGIKKIGSLCYSHKIVLE